MINKKAVFIATMAFSCIVLVASYKTEQVITLPKPTGPFAIGTLHLALTDTKRNERHAPGKKRELLLTILYPTDAKSTHYKSYLSDLLPYVKKDLISMKKIDASQLSYLDTIKSHALPNAPISNKQQVYPVIIFSPGFGSPIELYTTLLEDLASHGYIVIGINHPYVTNPVIFPDGRVVQAISIADMQPEQRQKFKNEELTTWVADVEFVLDDLSKINNNKESVLFKHLDLDAIGVMGHSFGGQIVDKVCRSNSSCKAGVNIEGKIAPQDAAQGFATPFLFLMAPHTNAQDDSAIEQLLTNIRAKAPAYLITIKDANHGTFTDLNLVFKKWFPSVIDPIRGIELSRAILLDFFNMQLKKQESKLLKSNMKQYPELLLK